VWSLLSGATPVFLSEKPGKNRDVRKRSTIRPESFLFWWGLVWLIPSVRSSLPETGPRPPHFRRKRRSEHVKFNSYNDIISNMAFYANSLTFFSGSTIFFGFSYSILLFLKLVFRILQVMLIFFDDEFAISKISGVCMSKKEVPKGETNDEIIIDL
jgi:hypothetical protein